MGLRQWKGGYETRRTGGGTRDAADVHRLESVCRSLNQYVVGGFAENSPSLVVLFFFSCFFLA